MTNNQTAVTPELIGKYLNRYGWSDVNPIGKIIGLVGKSSVLVQRVEAGENKTKMDFVSGGFAGVCINQGSQCYDFSETEETFKVRISKSLLKNIRIQDAPVKYYDYNF